MGGQALAYGTKDSKKYEFIDIALKVVAVCERAKSLSSRGSVKFYDCVID